VPGAILRPTERVSAAAKWRTFSAANPMARLFLGITWRRWLEYLVAILIGNAIYYFSLAPHLPSSLHHQGFQIDLGAAVDFLVCLAVYGLIRLRDRI